MVNKQTGIPLTLSMVPSSWLNFDVSVHLSSIAGVNHVHQWQSDSTPQPNILQESLQTKERIT